MKYLISISQSIGFLVIALLLSACGSDDDDEDVTNEIVNKLVGTWTTGCELDMDGNSFEAYTSTWVITSTKITNTGVEYSDQACETEVATFGPSELTFTIGESTSKTNGFDAYPLDVVAPNGETFTMISLQNDDTELHVATGSNDGETAATRQDAFLGEETRYKQ